METSRLHHRAFLEFILQQYVKEGVGELAQEKLPNLIDLKYHSIRDAGFQKYLYASV